MSGRTLVVTGANGFVGTHVAALAAADGVRVIGIGRETEPSAALAPHADTYFAADLEATWPVRERVDAIVHLAGLAAVGPSFAEPQRYLNVNSGIMTTMCETLLRSGHGTRVVVVSSGAVYSPPADGGAIAENDALAPGSPYAVAKILVETQAAYYALRGLDTLVARPFNHIGPGQGPGFVVPDLTAALESLEPGSPMRVGNLQSARDFTDVRDVARAYLTLAFAPAHRHRLYNVASGQAHSAYEILAEIATGLGRDIPTLEIDTARLRPDDPERVTGDSARLRDEFGWAPQLDWRRSVADFLAARA